MQVDVWNAESIRFQLPVGPVSGRYTFLYRHVCWRRNRTISMTTYILSRPIIHPEHDFSLTCKEWELRVFDAATLFTAFTFRGRFKTRRQEFDTLPPAIEAAQNDDRTCAYAVAQSGRSIVLDRADWPRWLERYRRNKAGY